MVKAGALYLALVVALIIAVLCTSILALAFYFRMEHLQDVRYNRLVNNINAGITIALTQKTADSLQHLDLYGDSADSIVLQKEKWGLFELTNIRSFIQKDTLSKSFLMGKTTDKDLACVYLSDEDRPISVSGNTRIAGEAKLPKAGVKLAYVEGKPYVGSQPVYGKITHSGRTLPPLDEAWLKSIKAYLAAKKETIPLFKEKTLKQPFLNQALWLKCSAKTNLDGADLKGKIILVSDTALSIPQTAKLENILVIAPSIEVEAGFKGNCQLIARDSINIGKGSIFSYPSSLSIIKDETAKNVQPKIILQDEVNFSGIIFTYEPKRTELQTLLSLGKSVVLKGEAYVTGLLKMEKGVKVEGKVSCNRFLMKMPSLVYENFLVDITIDRPQRNPYYLSSALFKPPDSEKKVLQWLN